MKGEREKKREEGNKARELKIKDKKEKGRKGEQEEAERETV